MPSNEKSALSGTVSPASSRMRHDAFPIQAPCRARREPGAPIAGFPALAELATRDQPCSEHLAADNPVQVPCFWPAGLSAEGTLLSSGMMIHVTR